MYQGENKGSGGVVGWGVGAALDTDLRVDADEAFDCSSGNEGVICQDPEGGIIIAVAQLSKDNGSLLWGRAEDPDSILRRTVSMSQMTSMLRDSHRNGVYDAAINACIHNFVTKTGRSPSALDIGTGTGMLAMACARAGARPVIAFEMFQKMASIADEVVLANGMEDAVTIVPFKSSDVTALPIVPDLLVSELLDSALLGEAVVMAHADAISRFMHTTDTDQVPIADRVIPNRAYVFGSLVESIEIQGMRCVSGIANNGVGVSAYRSEEARHCHGGAILIPVHWNEMVRRGACEVSDGHRLAEFVFHQLEQPGAPFDSGVVTELTVTRDGLVHGMLVWWEVKLLSKALDPEGKVSYSTAADAEQEWQDHWVQVVMPFAEIHSAVIGDVFKVALYNNGVNMWLELLSINHARTGGIKRKAAELADSSLREEVDPGTGPALCSCGWHLLCGAERLQTMNDTGFYNQWAAGLDYIIDKLGWQSCHLIPQIHVMDASDGSLLSLLFAKKYQLQLGLTQDELNSKLSVKSLERKIFSNIFFSQLTEANELAETISFFNSIEELNDEIDINDAESPRAPFINVLFSECYYFQLNSQPTWQSVSYLYIVNALCPLLREDAIIVPARARIMCAAVQLYDLYNSHGLVDKALGFDHTPLNEVQRDWSDHMYPYKIAEYRYKLLTEPCEIGELNYLRSEELRDQSVSRSVNCSFVSSGRCDAVVVWSDYSINESGALSVLCCENKVFAYHAKVSIKFFSAPVEIETISEHDLHVDTTFIYGASDFSYNFLVK